ncbi:MAG: hypothetical protein Q8M95_01480 [Candidatus Methanoperedens sp.]|nr:hypothetical protein [Candidatus Methanoperedens sp.]
MSVKKIFLISILIAGIVILIISGISINKPQQKGDPRIFQTSFESVDDFNGSYIVPQNYKNSSTHELSSEKVHSGSYSHKAWMYGANEPSTAILNNNHRAYPTVQLQKTPGGSFKTPVMITFWVWLDVNLSKRSPENEWFSFATLTQDPTDKWSR